MDNYFNKLSDIVKNHLIFDLSIHEKNSEKIRAAYRDLEKRLSKKSSNRILLRKARFVSIELIENVMRYGYFNGIYQSFVSIAFYKNKFYFSSGNLVANQEVEYIEHRLKEINSAYLSDKPRHVLRNMYRNKLSQVGTSENDIKIGILELARRLDDKIYYRFNKINNEFSEFTIICTINA
ncbi:MAG: DUF6272 family protein [Bacteroidales bacterium]|nr:DUF6272 family protein [Bacteroidales bacterium]